MVNSNKHYILKADHTVEKVDLMTWARWFEGSPERVVRHDKVKDFLISTVFLGLDYNFSRTGKPILFETMIFDNARSRTYTVGGREHTTHPDVYQDRYHTYDQALKAHNKIVRELVKNGKVEGMYNNDEETVDKDTGQ